MSRVHDVAIVGAGPAGAVTALLLARAGWDVALLDRAAFPREKACGDCLSAEATRLLEQLGVLPEVMRCAPAKLQGWRIVADDASSFEASFASCGAPDALATPRERLDTVLAHAARAAGAQLIEHTTVREVERNGSFMLRTSNGPVKAHVIVGADGLRSRIAAQFGLVRRSARLRKVSITLHVHDTKRDPRYGEMHLSRDGCVGIAPVAADGAVWNVTVVVPAQAHGKAIRADAEAFARSYTRGFPALRGLKLERVATTRVLASGPFDRPVRTPVLPGIALVGDAAGYFDPFTGQGVFHALRGAGILAEELCDALRTNVAAQFPLEGYRRRLRALSREARVLQRGVELVVSRDWLARRVIRRLARRPGAASAIIAATGDIMPAHRLLSPSLLVSFLR